MNIKIVISIILILLTLALVTLLLIKLQSPEPIYYNGVTIQPHDYNAIMNTLGNNYSNIAVCNIDNGNCILLSRFYND